MAYSQCSDLIQLYHNLFNKSLQTIQEERLLARSEIADIYRELEVERLKHAETKQLLADESQKLHLIDAEMKVLQRQLIREKATFENAFGMLQTKELANASTPEKMTSRITALEAACQEKDKEIEYKEKELRKLHKTIDSMKKSHKKQIEEIKLATQQELYLVHKEKQTRTR